MLCNPTADLIPSHLGAIPADCVPLYERIAREGTPESRYSGCYALLFFTDSTDVVPIVIDLVDQESPEDMRVGSCGPILLLRDRFAANYFWDTAAWRDWWNTLVPSLRIARSLFYGGADSRARDDVNMLKA